MLNDQTRRGFVGTLIALPIGAIASEAGAKALNQLSIVEAGALPDGKTINTKAIQTTIDRLAAKGGGTVIVPRGVFVSGAIFLKPRVDLHLDQGAVLRCTTDMAHFPSQRTRIEGHFEPSFTPALINAKGCDALKITGEGTLDGAGRTIWDEFWKRHDAAPDPHNFPNLSIPRARLALIEASRGVLIEGITFKDSQFWNLHIYRCQDVTVRNARFQVPDDYKQAPSTDGIDLDSSQRVTIDGCTFSVTDDCIALKGSKGPRALEDESSPPVEQIRVRNCTFRRGHHSLACGSEATIVRDVVMENCRVTGDMILARLKLRPDTPQHYEDIHFRNITLDNAHGAIVGIQPWDQYFDLKGEAPPRSIVRNLSLVGIRGRFGAFGIIKPNPGQTEIVDVLLKDIDVQLEQPELASAGVSGMKLENVRVNGKAVTA